MLLCEQRDGGGVTGWGRRRWQDQALRLRLQRHPAPSPIYVQSASTRRDPQNGKPAFIAKRDGASITAGARTHMYKEGGSLSSWTRDNLLTQNVAWLLEAIQDVYVPNFSFKVSEPAVRILNYGLIFGHSKPLFKIMANTFIFADLGSFLFPVF